MSTFSNEAMNKLLLDILSFRRPHGSKTEARFINDYLLPLQMKWDKMGNLIKKIGESPIMWSCHTDTVHRKGGIQRLKIKSGGKIVVNDTSSNCLGADDGAGVWLMMNMIMANRPGLYIFHRGEERGCIGSRWLTANTPEVVKGIRAAIALDRRGKDSIITRQMGDRCCSEEFAASLGSVIGMAHKADPTGSFTDTAHYTDIIGECTNLSVGYQGEHWREESLDAVYLMQLNEKLLQFDHTGLVYKRKPGEQDRSWGGYGTYGKSYQTPTATRGIGHYTDYGGKKTYAGSKKARVLRSGRLDGSDKRDSSLYDEAGRPLEIERLNSTPGMAALCRDHHEIIADFLEECGFDTGAIEELVLERGGVIKGTRLL